MLNGKIKFVVKDEEGRLIEGADVTCWAGDVLASTARSDSRGVVLLTAPLGATVRWHAVPPPAGLVIVGTPYMRADGWSNPIKLPAWTLLYPFPGATVRIAPARAQPPAQARSIATRLIAVA